MSTLVTDHIDEYAEAFVWFQFIEGKWIAGVLAGPVEGIRCYRIRIPVPAQECEALGIVGHAGEATVELEPVATPPA